MTIIPSSIVTTSVLACSQQDVPGQHNVSLGPEGGLKDLFPLTRGDVPRVILDFMSLGTVKPLCKSAIDLRQINLGFGLHIARLITSHFSLQVTAIHDNLITSSYSNFNNLNLGFHPH